MNKVLPIVKSMIIFDGAFLFFFGRLYAHMYHAAKSSAQTYKKALKKCIGNVLSLGTNFIKKSKILMPTKQH